jgi:hypothetical protein
MLSPEQRSYFETFGFLQVKQAFSSEETAAIIAAFDDVLTQARGGEPYGGRGQSVWSVVEKSPVLSDIVEDDRVFEPVAELLGPGFIWAGAEGNITSHNEHDWHADRHGESEAAYRRVKVMLYLDPTTKERGALRVIPGSHKGPFHLALARPLQDELREPGSTGFGVSGRDLPSVPVESQPGDVVFFSQSLFHAVYAGFDGRRYIALKFAAKPTTDEHLASLVRYTSNIFDPDAAFVNSDRPRIREIVCPLLDLKSRAPEPSRRAPSAGMMGPQVR